MADFENLTTAVRDFAHERDWGKFHSPKNLSMALAVEAAELLEHFQWLTEDQSSELSEAKLEFVSQEIADVQIYLMRLADRLEIDVLAAVASKLELNESRYPVDKARGSARKYTEYDENTPS